MDGLTFPSSMVDSSGLTVHLRIFSETDLRQKQGQRMYNAQGPEVILLRIFSYVWQSRKDIGFCNSSCKFDNVANVYGVAVTIRRSDQV